MGNYRHVEARSMEIPHRRSACTAGQTRCLMDGAIKGMHAQAGFRSMIETCAHEAKNGVGFSSWLSDLCRCRCAAQTRQQCGAGSHGKDDRFSVGLNLRTTDSRLSGNHQHLGRPSSASTISANPIVSTCAPNTGALILKRRRLAHTLPSRRQN